MPFTKAREEGKIFADLATLCASPGYIHALAALCFRDNVIRHSGEIRVEDLHPIFRESRLIRTEASTLIGPMAKADIDLALPSRDVLKGYIVDAANRTRRACRTQMTRPVAWTVRVDRADKHDGRA